MNCPICASELKEGHIAARHYSLVCDKDDGGHYQILKEYDAKDNLFIVSNETFRYGDIVMQKVYYRDNRYPDFYWSIRHERKVNYGPWETLHSLHLNNQEFINKFGHFNPNNIDPIRLRFEMFETFS